MKIPLWKKIWSYIADVSIEKTVGQHNPFLEVIYSKGRFQLATANAIYSHEDLYTNYFHCFKNIKINQRKEIEEVLILGLGLGSIPYMLEKNFHCSFNYTAVEFDEEVIYLANKYSLSKTKSSIEYICADALLYVMQCEQKFDLICVDIFMDDVIPQAFQEVDFLHNIKELLSPNGLVLYNCLGYSEEDKKSADDFFQHQFKQVFSHGEMMPVSKNRMLINRSVI